MALATCGNADVMRARIHMGSRGAWWLEAKLDTATKPTGQVTFAADGGLNLTGTVVPDRGGVFLDSALVRVVGGGAGLQTILTPLAYRNALLRDPLGYVLDGAGEILSGTVDAAVLSLFLLNWTISAETAATALDALAQAVGPGTTWRTVADGTIWMGAETWPAQSLPGDADVLHEYPEEGRYEIGCATPALVPGVNLTDIGANIVGVDHWIADDQVRSWAWV